MRFGFGNRTFAIFTKALFLCKIVKNNSMEYKNGSCMGNVGPFYCTGKLSG